MPVFVIFFKQVLAIRRFRNKILLDDLLIEMSDVLLKAIAVVVFPAQWTRHVQHTRNAC